MNVYGSKKLSLPLHKYSSAILDATLSILIGLLPLGLLAARASSFTLLPSTTLSLPTLSPHPLTTLNRSPHGVAFDSHGAAFSSFPIRRALRPTVPPTPSLASLSASPHYHYIPPTSLLTPPRRLIALRSPPVTPSLPGTTSPPTTSRPRQHHLPQPHLSCLRPVALPTAPASRCFSRADSSNPYTTLTPAAPPPPYPSVCCSLLCTDHSPVSRLLLPQLSPSALTLPHPRQPRWFSCFHRIL